MAQFRYLTKLESWWAEGPTTCALYVVRKNAEWNRERQRSFLEDGGRKQLNGDGGVMKQRENEKQGGLDACHVARSSRTVTKVACGCPEKEARKRLYPPQQMRNYEKKG